MNHILAGIVALLSVGFLILSIYYFRLHKKAVELAKTLPIVQHCNSRTDYEFIKHRWDPERCVHCKEVQDILNEH